MVAFDEHYTEDLELRDGERVRFRLVRPSDKRKLEEGFDRLSSESRYRRFMVQKKALTDSELRFFTEVDGFDHFAIVAVSLGGSGDEGDGIGIARFVRIVDEPEVAEMAVAVVDEKHGKGVGRLLLERLSAAAAERGIRRIRCHVLADNDRMRNLIKRVFGEGLFQRDGAMLVADLPIPEPVQATRVTAEEATVFDLLRLAAEGVVVIPMIIGLDLLERGVERLNAHLLRNETPRDETPADPDVD